ncbi:putative disease resistance protein At5g05400 [Quercus suber]|uniref:putative disease resistance protein At5g05400 n=1 Tax=Quercus suber TaxID=58331 RepID=UPI000CE1B398|nr:putative disease resistance protein At5g05400 [Quercus suber]
MEMLGAVLELAKIILAPIRDCCNYHRHVDEHMINLRDRWQDLNGQKSDIESRMRAQLRPGKTPKLEVTAWIQHVERMNNEIQAIESEAEEVKCFLRARIGKHALKKKLEADELYQRGGAFTVSLVVDPPVSNGEEFPTTKLIGKSTTERVKEEILAYVLGNGVGKIGVYGMGGIGKSTIMEHINNHLLKDKKNFDSVIWVTMSKSSNVLELQNAIAHKLALDLAKSEYKRERAAKIKEELEKRKSMC